MGPLHASFHPQHQLKTRGEAGELQEQMVQVRAERMQLALELHDSKEAARHAEQDIQLARSLAVEASSEVTALREELQLVEVERAIAFRRVEQGVGEIAALSEKGTALSHMSADLSAELLAAESELGTLAQQRGALIQQVQNSDLLISELQAELECQQQDFQVPIFSIRGVHACPPPVLLPWSACVPPVVMRTWRRAAPRVVVAV